MKDLYEAFNYFYSGNKAIGMLATNPTVAKPHFIKQEIGNKFMYNCENYGIKFNQVFELVFRCEIIRYVVENNNEVIKDRLGFTYDFMNDELIRVDYLYTPYSTLSNKESVKVLFK